MINFLTWYMIRAPRAQLYFAWHTLIFFEDFMGIKTNIIYYFAPIFGDKTIIGRVLSLIIRTTIILTGFIAITMLAILLIAIPIMWIGTIIIWMVQPIILIVPIIGAMYYILTARKKAKKINYYKHQHMQIENFFDTEVKSLIMPPYNQEYYEVIIENKSIKHFLQRLCLPANHCEPLFKNNNAYDENKLLEMIKKIAITHQIRKIRPIHVFLAHLLLRPEHTETILQKQKIDLKQLLKYTIWEENENIIKNPPRIWEEDYRLNTEGGTNVTWQGTVTPYLNMYSQDITKRVTKEQIRVVRQELINEIEQGLQKSQSGSVLLVGEIGVGKDKLVEIIAQKINQGIIRGFLWSKRIVKLDIGKLYAGATKKGEFESRVETIIEEINRSGNIVLYLNDFKSALEINNAGTISLFSLLKEPIAKNKLHIIGALTPRELTIIQNENPHFLQEFTIIRINEPNKEETTSILFNEALNKETHTPIFIPYPSIETIYEYANEYIKNEHFPQKGLRLLEEVITTAMTQRLKTQWLTIYGKKVPILDNIINETIAKKFHIQVGEMQKEETKKLLNLENIFAQKIIGQSDAVKAIAEVLRRNRLGIRNKNKPVGSFLFVGPTGVGKTKMAKILAEEYYGDINQLIRLDMSEYQTQDSIDRIIGSIKMPTDITTLAEKLKNQPFALVLLDEIEKAHPKILDIFLQVLDDARLTNVQGETIICNEAIFIATSNAGNKEITEMFQSKTNPHTYEDINKEIYHILSKYFRLEFLNRFDDIIIFKPLTPASIEKITKNELEEISQSIYADKKIKLQFSPTTIQQVIKEGYNPELGARPLERAIQNIIQAEIAKKMLQKEITPGSTIEI